LGPFQTKKKPLATLRPDMTKYGPIRTPLILRYLGPWFPAQTPEVCGFADCTTTANLGQPDAGNAKIA
jgi:hypothetical protein